MPIAAASVFAGDTGHDSARTSRNAAAGQTTSERVQRGIGTVTKVARELGAVVIAHDPVPSLDWPAMTMTFAVPGRLIDRIEEGDRVEFQFIQSGDSYVITAIR